MEWGFDGVLLNTAVSRALDPVRMASAFATAIKGGRSAFLAGPMSVQEIAVASTLQIVVPSRSTLERNVCRYAARGQVIDSRFYVQVNNFRFARHSGAMYEVTPLTVEEGHHDTSVIRST
jgi:hypothetical protein